MTERLDWGRQTLRELAAEYRWLRSDEVDEWSAQPENRERVAAEAADVGICERVGIHFLDAIERKIEVNRRNYPVEASRGEGERPQMGAK